jgi:fructokinase
MSSEMLAAGIGEILMDVFENGKATLGGAPLNVAFHVNQLLKTPQLGSGVMVSRIGKDHWGDLIRASLQKSEMSLDYISVDSKHPTGTASVIESKGEAGFEIKRTWHGTTYVQRLRLTCWPPAAAPLRSAV